MCWQPFRACCKVDDFFGWYAGWGTLSEGGMQVAAPASKWLGRRRQMLLNCAVGIRFCCCCCCCAWGSKRLRFALTCIETQKQQYVTGITGFSFILLSWVLTFSRIEVKRFDQGSLWWLRPNVIVYHTVKWIFIYRRDENHCVTVVVANYYTSPKSRVTNYLKYQRSMIRKCEWNICAPRMK